MEFPGKGGGDLSGKKVDRSSGGKWAVFDLAAAFNNFNGLHPTHSRKIVRSRF